MKNKCWVVLAGILIFYEASGFAQTIVTREKEKYFHKDGRIEKSEGQFEYTYFLDSENNKLIRTRVYDYQKKEIKPDNTVYAINPYLNSHPLNAAKHNLTPVITAVGQPADTALEIVVIKADGAETTTAENGGIVVSHCERLG